MLISQSHKQNLTNFQNFRRLNDKYLILYQNRFEISNSRIGFVQKIPKKKKKKENPLPDKIIPLDLPTEYSVNR